MKGDTSTRDSVVNQLLVLMDGVAQLPVPTFVLALTNRRELIDDAILRPGRLEVRAGARVRVRVRDSRCNPDPDPDPDLKPNQP